MRLSRPVAFRLGEPSLVELEPKRQEQALELLADLLLEAVHNVVVETPSEGPALIEAEQEE